MTQLDLASAFLNAERLKGAQQGRQFQQQEFESAQAKDKAAQERDALFNQTAAEYVHGGDNSSLFAKMAQIDPQRTILVRQAIEGRGSGTPAQLQFFEELTKGLTPEQRQRAREIHLGLTPRAVGSGAITTAITPGLTDSVAESERQITSQKKLGEGTAKTTTETIDKSIEKVERITKNISNIDRAIDAIDRGASTGAIERFYPSIKAASVELDQIQGELGLDVVGATTFGALSKGELDLAKSVAIPTGLQPTQLRKWLQDKKNAQAKLSDYYNEQIQFLAQGGTVPEFLAMKKSQPVKSLQELSDDDLLNF